MKRVGILTVTGDNNYGNKLQNYAMEKIVSEIGFIPETIRIDEKNHFYMRFITYIQVVFFPILGVLKKKRIIRRLAFYRFNRKIHTKTFLRKGTPHDIIRKKLSYYDYLIFGSDQIWNPELPQFTDIFLGFYSPKEKNVAVSASMGVARIPEQYIETFRNGLHNFRGISVREHDAKKAVEDLDEGLTAVVLPDPTLMLDCTQWTKVERKTKRPNRYYLKYFLGHEDKETIKGILENGNYDCIDANPTSPYGPDEFVYLVHHADAVLTDSYHSTVFSIMFGIPVYIFERRDEHSSMSSRIYTLLEETGISYTQNEHYIYIAKNTIDDDSVRNMIQRKREQFKNYLLSNLSN